MRALKTAVCIDCDVRTLLHSLNVETLHVCRTLPELFWALGSMPDLIVATGPAALADRVRKREWMTYPAIIFLEAEPEGRLNCLQAAPEQASLAAALEQLQLIRQQAPAGAHARAKQILARLGVKEGPGHDMLLCAILYAYLDRKILNDMMGGLYALVAERFSATPVYVKQRIYRAIERAWTKGDAQAQYDTFLNTIDEKRAKPTNTEMIALIADILRLEGFEWRTSNGLL